MGLFAQPPEKVNIRQADSLRRTKSNERMGVNLLSWFSIIQVEPALMKPILSLG